MVLSPGSSVSPWEGDVIASMSLLVILSLSLDQQGLLVSLDTHPAVMVAAGYLPLSLTLLPTFKIQLESLE